MPTSPHADATPTLVSHPATPVGATTPTLRWDIESRSDCEIRDCGSYVYATHPTTEIMCFAWAIDDGPVYQWPKDDPQPFIDAILAGARIEAHNAGFEYYMYRHIMHERHGWPMPCPEQWCCSAAVAARHSLPRSLEAAGHALGLTEQKDKEGHRLMQKMSKPRRASNASRWKWHESETDLQRLYAYNRQDVVAERAISNHLGHLEPSEQATWLLDQRINQRGIRCDIETIKGAIIICDKVLERANEDIAFYTQGAATTVNQRDRLLGWLETRGLKMSKFDKAAIKDALETYGEQLPSDVRAVLKLRQSVGKSSIKKYKKMLAQADPNDHRLREILRFYAAHTGRWGGMGPQVQNFPRKTLKGDELALAIEVIRAGNLDTLEMLWGSPLDVLSKCLRSMLMAAPGHRLMCGDYSSVEARGLVWLADDKAGLQIFYDGLDPYKAMSSTIYGIPIEEVTDDQRFMGKTAVLGLGYGLGWKKYVVYAKDVWGKTIDEAFAQRVVNSYRALYSSVVDMWHAVERAAISAVNHPGHVFESHKCRFYVDSKNFLNIELPSGRPIKYYNPKIKAKTTPWGQQKATLSYRSSNAQNQWVRTYTWGGKLVENIVQGLCRDLLVNSMHNVENAGYPIVLSLHDEIVSEKKGGSLNEFVDTMELKPDWAAGLPLKVGDDAWEGERYRK